MKIILIFVFTIFILVYLIRLLNTKALDDLSPEIPCDESLIEKSEILFVIPIYNEKPISENKSWCNQILLLNKTLGMHGIYHTYKEFKTTKTQEELEKGIIEFEKCFGYQPEIFKPPQLEINKQNKKLIKSNKLVLKGKISQTTHKVYHCNDTGVIKNRIIDII